MIGRPGSPNGRELRSYSEPNYLRLGKIKRPRKSRQANPARPKDSSGGTSPGAPPAGVLPKPCLALETPAVAPRIFSQSGERAAPSSAALTQPPFECPARIASRTNGAPFSLPMNLEPYDHWDRCLLVSQRQLPSLPAGKRRGEGDRVRGRIKTSQSASIAWA